MIGLPCEVAAAFCMDEMKTVLAEFFTKVSFTNFLLVPWAPGFFDAQNQMGPVLTGPIVRIMESGTMQMKLK